MLPTTLTFGRCVHNWLSIIWERSQSPESKTCSQTGGGIDLSFITSFITSIFVNSLYERKPKVLLVKDLRIEMERSYTSSIRQQSHSVFPVCESIRPGPGNQRPYFFKPTTWISPRFCKVLTSDCTWVGLSAEST